MKLVFVRASLLGSTLVALAAAQPAPGAQPPAAQPPAGAPVASPAAQAPATQPAPAPQPVTAQAAVPPTPAPYLGTGMVTDTSPAYGPATPEPDTASTSESSESQDPPRFNVALNVDELWHTQRSYDLFSDNNVQVSVGASIGYAVWVNGPWSVVPEIGFGVDERSGGSRYGTAVESSKLDSFRGYAGGRVRYLLLPFLEPHVRLAGGLESLQASVRSSTGETFEGSANPFFASIGAGFSLHTLPGNLTKKRGGFGALIVGFVVEGGYTAAASMDLALAPAGTPPRVQTEAASFGTLERSGPYLRFAGDVRF